MTKYIDDEKEQMRILRIYDYFDPMRFSVVTDREQTTVERKLKKLSSVNHDRNFELTVFSLPDSRT